MLSWSGETLLGQAEDAAIRPCNHAQLICRQYVGHVQLPLLSILQPPRLCVISLPFPHPSPNKTPSHRCPLLSPAYGFG